MYDTGQHWLFPHPVVHYALPSITALRLQHWLTQQGVPWHFEALQAHQITENRVGMGLLSAIRGITPVSYFGPTRLLGLPVNICQWPWEKSEF